MTKQYSKRNAHAVNVGRLVSQVAKPILRRRGFHDVDIIGDWEHIVGPQWAKQTSPHKLSFNPQNRRAGTLEMIVTPGASVLIQHIEPMIIDRINTYFGFDAVNRLKIIHGYVPNREPKPAPNRHAHKPLPEVEGISDDELKKALQHLGQCLAKDE